MKEMTQYELTAYNEAVHAAYSRIFTTTKQLLATLERNDLRLIMERNWNPNLPDTIVHEVIAPILFLRLSVDETTRYCIHFGIEQSDDCEVIEVTGSFMRKLFTETAKRRKSIVIEQALCTDWFISNCSEMYEHMDEHSRYHTYSMLPYHPTRRAVLV